MSFNTMMASNQWATRPADQRFWDLDELQSAVEAHKAAAVMAECSEDSLRVEADGDAIRLVGKTGQAADLSHWAFGQLASRADFPAGPLRTLPATLASNVINHKLSKLGRSDKTVQLLVNDNGGFLIRSMASQLWSPIWNADIVTHVQRLADGGCWAPPPAYPTIYGASNFRIATAEDARRSLTIKEGDTIGPSGLYASAEDMFIFLTNPNSVIRDGSAEGLQRGFIVQNAEVCGKLAFKIYTFYLRGVCGNHIIWNPSGVTEISIKHVGTAPERAFRKIGVAVREYADASAETDEARIKSAQNMTIAATREEVIAEVFKRKILTRTAADAAYQAADNHSDVDGDPRTFWGFAQGITRYSQTLPNAETRTATDKAAGALLSLVS